jgi:hypothetical protein
VILEKELDHDDGELTATQKVRRGMIGKKFARETRADLRWRHRLMDYFIQLLVSGIAAGLVYGFIGMGFAMIYRATGVVNFAQGELMMLVAYIACC